MSAVLAAMPLFLNAQSVTTVPVGAMTYTFPATTQVTTTYISIPLTNPAVYTLPVASLTANTITFSGTPFPAGGLAQTGSPFFARIATGAQAGRTILITANTSSTITVDSTDHSSQTTALNTSGWTVAAGDRIEVIVGDTLASIFGDGSVNNPLKFVGGTSIFTADAVGIYNKITAKFDAYYFNTTNNYWRVNTSASNLNNIVIYPENSIQISQKSGRSGLALVVIGEVPVSAPLTKITGSAATIYSGTRFPVDVKFSQLLFNNWTKANSVFTADTLGVYNPTTAKLDVFYQRLDNGQWRKSGDNVTDYTNYVLPAGSAVAIARRSAVSGSSSFVSAPVPYSL
ncbi:MAG: TIGR02597 family protein [Opitutaceae bacterium]